jgi:hypothetical protein
MNASERQDQLLHEANELTDQIDVDYRLQLEEMVEEIDAEKARKFTLFDEELNKQQANILQSAKNEIDRLTQKEIQAKIGILQEAQAAAAADVNAIAAQTAHLYEASTVHYSTGTTTIETEVSGEATTKEIDGSTNATEITEASF